MEKENLLIIGGFSNDASLIGGVTKSCRILINSHFKDHFNLILLDSNIISNPPPNIVIRFIYSIRRQYNFLEILLKERPKKILIFASDGLSFIEKSFMGFIGEIFGIRSFLFLRAGNLVNQIKNNNLYSLLGNFFCKRITCLLCQGESMRNHLHMHLNFDLDNIFVVPNWTAKINKDSNTRLPMSKNHDIKFLYSGWIIKEKGLFELIEAFKILVKKYPDIELDIVGEGIDLENLKEKVNANNLQHSINFLGWKDNSSISQILSQNYIYVHPSWNEGMSNSVIEAMASCLPVITTPVGVMPDYLKHNKSVLFVNSKDTKELHLAMEMLLCDTNKRTDIAESGYKVAMENFTPNTGINILIKAINKFQ